MPSEIRGSDNFDSDSVGKVLQVVHTAFSTTQTTSSTSYVDITNATASITPSSTSSKILALVNVGAWQGSSYESRITLYRDATDLTTSPPLIRIRNARNDNSSVELISGNHYDSPSSTSALVYKLKMKCGNSGYPLYINRDTASSTVETVSTITLLEIGA